MWTRRGPPHTLVVATLSILRSSSVPRRPVHCSNPRSLPSTHATDLVRGFLILQQQINEVDRPLFNGEV